jgi:hypothetical protein
LSLLSEISKVAIGPIKPLGFSPIGLFTHRASFWVEPQLVW